MELPGIPRITSRTASFLYVERAVVSKQDSSLLLKDAEGEILLPLNSLVVLMLGPGTSVTDKAIILANENGVTLVWVGEGLIRFYASGHPLTKSSKILSQQALLVSNIHSRTKIARDMYQMRFPDEDVSNNTIQQLRGKEGTRVKNFYKTEADKHGIKWSNRKTQMDQISDDDNVNKAITMATSALYGVCHAVIIAIGASPGLGFVHTGHMLSFVFDIADLYKTRIAVPTAFETISNPDNIEILDYAIRKNMRLAIHKSKLLQTIVDDIKQLFGTDEELWDFDEVLLFDEMESYVAANKNWG